MKFFQENASREISSELYSDERDYSGNAWKFARHFC